MLATHNTGHKRRLDNTEPKLKLYRSINDQAHMLRVKPGYEIFPSAAEIFERRFIITNLMIRNGSTKAQWKGSVNLRNLKAPLSQLIDLGRTHIEVYPNQQQKPMAGNELNKTCFVTFSNLKPINRRKLKKICQASDCQLLSINSQHNQFTVQIPHFSKYSFNAQQDSSSQSGDEGEVVGEMIGVGEDRRRGEESFSSQLKEIHAKRLMEEKEQVRKTMTVPIVDRTKTLPLPNPPHLLQTHHQNLSHGHQIPSPRLSGTSTAISQNSQITTYISTTNLHFLLFNQKKSHPDYLMRVVVDLLKDSRMIGKYIFQGQGDLEVVRVLTLNVICFGFQQCCFGFGRGQAGLELVRIDRPPGAHHRSKYFKNWFEWAINKCPEQVPCQNDLLHSLALRRVGEQAQKCLKFKQKEDGQFLAVIEDENYRHGEPPRQLSRELRAISLGDMSCFNRMGWFVRFGVCLWYYCFQDNADEKLISIIKQSILNSEQQYNIQRHILSIYLKLPFTNSILTHPNEPEYPLWYYIQNINNRIQTQLNKTHEPKNISDLSNPTVTVSVNQQYRNYRYNLVAELVEMFQDHRLVVDVVGMDGMLGRDDKERILGRFVRRQLGDEMAAGDWGDYSNLVYIAKAEAHYSNREYLKSLEYFGKCDLVTGHALEIVKNIAKKQEILCGFHRKTIERTKKLLQGIRTPQHDLECQIMFLNTTLGKQHLDPKGVLKMIEMCNRVPNESNRRRMLQIIFKQAIKNPSVIAQLKRNSSFYQKMQKIYPDNSHLLQMKLVRLQL